ncbi:MAG TPA: hypothetical protein VND45_03270 [Thermoanaerobaculia bacterium]|nr:hypothetical protein [Thermoanaerobaculia bacterium]
MWKKLQIAAIVGTSILLLIAGSVVFMERRFEDPPRSTKRESFLYGTIGVEIMPLVVFQVLPDMFPDRFQPAGPKEGDWIQQYGFVRNTTGENYGLPHGFAVSHYRPRSGGPLPVHFVGFSCGLCHTANFRTTEKQEGPVVVGMGNNALDLFAWVEALQGALLDEQRLTVDAVDHAYQKKFHRKLKVVEKVVIANWLKQARKSLETGIAKWDAPWGPKELRNAAYQPNGPSRTQAFRELVRLYMDRPAASDRSYSKLPPVYGQRFREWAQADGSVRSPTTRSVFAALAAGATVDNLVMPGIHGNLKNNVEFTRDLQWPKWNELLPNHPIAADRAARGRQLYMRHCGDCHGWPDGQGGWVNGKRMGEVIDATVIGTDPERVNYRYYDTLTTKLWEAIPASNPLKPHREDVRPGPLGATRGYINAPLEGLFTRVPYFHNGSVLTLAEVINLEPRRDVFYRGRNLYDPVRVGLASPDALDSRHYYRFDTRLVGNSNKGHDFPWTYKGPGWDEAQLRDLLEYLKTL